MTKKSTTELPFRIDLDHLNRLDHMFRRDPEALRQAARLELAWRRLQAMTPAERAAHFERAFAESPTLGALAAVAAEMLVSDEPGQA